MSDTADDVVAPGMVLGNYRIERLLGRGGMGAVFLAYDTTLHRSVALKILAGATTTGDARANLLREARNAAALNHPSICTIHEVSTAHGAEFIAMEYVEGRSLRDRLEGVALPLEKALRYALQSADALAYAHEHGVVHRDFKAANIIVTDDGRVKIVDFGLARREDGQIAAATTMVSLVPAGALAGTPYAMSPEQVRGEQADGRTDIWALGVLLYEMTTGTSPFHGATTPELFSSILRDQPAPMPGALAPEVFQVIGRCLEKTPARRFQSARDVRAALEAVLTGTSPRLPVSRRRVGLSRRRWQFGVAATVVAAALALGFGSRAIWDRVIGGRIAGLRLAVLPFENLTGDPEQAYLSDGLTEELVTKLGRLHPSRLTVIARTSSRRYNSSDTPINQIRQELGVDFVLEGSVRREDNRVRVSATLVDTRDQSQRWGGSFEREIASIMALQSDIAFNVSKSLAFALLPAEQARLAGPALVNPEAYEAYLKGLARQSTLGRANLDAAEGFFNTALEKDPTYALAFAGIAGIWIGRQQTGITPRIDAAPKIRSALAKALELDDTLAAAHFRLGELYAWTDWNWPAAAREFERAIDLNPNEAPTRALYADYLAIRGRPEQAIAQITRAVELDPRNPQTQVLPLTRDRVNLDGLDGPRLLG